MKTISREEAFQRICAALDATDDAKQVEIRGSLIKKLIARGRTPLASAKPFQMVEDGAKLDLTRDDHYFLDIKMLSTVTGGWRLADLAKLCGVLAAGEQVAPLKAKKTRR